MLADIDPFSLGTVNVSLDQKFSANVKGTTAEVIFYPRENAVALEISQGSSQFRQFWYEDGRRLFIEALKKYKEDFANQKLVTSYNKSRAMYGNVDGWFQWKPLGISRTYEASPVIELGYRFRDGSPFFSANQKKAAEETQANKGITTSPPLSIYFTRAQAEELAEFFNQMFLLELLGDKELPAAANFDRDVYVEK